jgi:type II secretory pathway pseudopilin PulG
MEAGRRIKGHQGETLLEVLVAVTILGVCVVAIGASIALSVRVSDIQHNQSTAGSIVRSYAEAIQRSVDATPSAYDICAAPAAYATPSGFVVSNNFQAKVTNVAYLNDMSGLPVATCAASGYSGAQRIDLEVDAVNHGGLVASEHLSIFVRKP